MTNIETDLTSFAAHFDLGPIPEGPRVVAIGGGRGLAIALKAAREYAGQITAIVSVADDGGSSGRLRRDLDVLAPGDLRKAIGALAADESSWKVALEHRFAAGALEGHALGNIMLVGLAESLGGWGAALAEMGRVVGAVGSVVPATMDPVVIKADVGGTPVEGQTAIQQAGGRAAIRNLHLVPHDVAAAPAALEAIMTADQIVIGPGSLYTSILAAVVVPEIRTALALSPASVVQVANLATEDPETVGLDGTDHLLAVLEHRVRVDTFVYDPRSPLSVNAAYVFEHGVMAVNAEVAADDVRDAEPGPGPGPDREASPPRHHDPRRLATALADLLA